MARTRHELVIFDLDGTLAESKSAMDSEMSALLNRLIGKIKVAVISGGSYAQFQKQFLVGLSAPKKLLKNLFLFPTCGASFWRFNDDWTEVYKHELAVEEKVAIFEAFDEALRAAGFERPEKIYGELIEDRGTQITFSAHGQLAPVDLKKQWDPDQKKRLHIKKFLDRSLPHLEVRIGGATSIDVTKKGIDKAYGIKQMEKHLNVPREKMFFLGDAIFPGGNDYPVFEIGVESVRVDGPHETKKHIQKLIASR